MKFMFFERNFAVFKLKSMILVLMRILASSRFFRSQTEIWGYIEDLQNCRKYHRIRALYALRSASNTTKNVLLQNGGRLYGDDF